MKNREMDSKAIFCGYGVNEPKPFLSGSWRIVRRWLTNERIINDESLFLTFFF